MKYLGEYRMENSEKIFDIKKVTLKLEGGTLRVISENGKEKLVYSGLQFLSLQSH